MPCSYFVPREEFDIGFAILGRAPLFESVDARFQAFDKRFALTRKPPRTYYLGMAGGRVIDNVNKRDDLARGSRSETNAAIRA